MDKSRILSAAKDGMCAEGLRILHDVMDAADAIHDGADARSLKTVRDAGIAALQVHNEACGTCFSANAVAGRRLVKGGE